jgi:hypothetical protein
MQPKTYEEKFTNVRTRSIEYLKARAFGGETCIKVRDLKRYFHGSTGAALLAPVLMALEREGYIECVGGEKRGGGLMYLTSKWANERYALAEREGSQDGD